VSAVRILLVPLLLRVQIAAPQAAVALIGWPSRSDRQHGRVVRILANQIEREMRAVTRSYAIDAVFASELVFVAKGSPRAKVGTFSSDGVHPSELGHAMLSAAVAALIARRLAMPRRARVLTPPPPPDLESLEWCWSASALPLAESRGWQLVDEGKHGSKKEGYLSHVSASHRKESNRLSLGPLLPNVSCAFLTAELGYLQSWRPSAGSFQIDCTGCFCTRVPGTWSAEAHPFPIVETNTLKRPDSLNATQTVFTRFHILKFGPQSVPASCFVHLSQHKQRNDSRVRIDSLSLRVAGCSEQCNVVHKGGSYSVREWTKQYAPECAKGARSAALSMDATAEPMWINPLSHQSQVHVPSHLGPSCLVPTRENLSTATQLCHEWLSAFAGA